MAAFYYARVSAGQLEIPAHLQNSLGLAEEDCLLLHIEDGRLIGVHESKRHMTGESYDRLQAEYDEIDRMTGSMPELRGAVEKLIEERKHDRW